MNTIKERLQALLMTVLEDSRINKAFQPVIKNLALSLLEKIPEDELRQAVEKLRDEMIPWILEGDKLLENPHPQ